MRQNTQNFKLAEKNEPSSKILSSFLKILTDNKIVDEIVE